MVEKLVKSLFLCNEKITACKALTRDKRRDATNPATNNLKASVRIKRKAKPEGQTRIDTLLRVLYFTFGLHGKVMLLRGIN